MGEWQGCEVGGVTRVLVLFKGGGCRVSPRLHGIVSDVNQGNNGVRWVQDFLAWTQEWKDSP